MTDSHTLLDGNSEGPERASVLEYYQITNPVSHLTVLGRSESGAKLLQAFGNIFCHVTSLGPLSTEGLSESFILSVKPHHISLPSSHAFFS